MNAASKRTREPPAGEAGPRRATIAIWWCDVDEISRTEVESLERMLPARERDAAARFRSEVLRRRHIVAHAMTLDALGRCAKPQRRPVLARGPHGKPHVAEPRALRHLRFSLSGSGSMAMVAVSAGREVGIDVERIRADIDIAGPASMCFTERELGALGQVPRADRVAAFFSCWTRKEALLKGQGTGLLRPPDGVEVGLGQYAPQKTGRPDEAIEGWFVAALDLGAAYAGAVALEGSEFEPSLRRWKPPGDRVPSGLRA